jgi:hypothetical protein
MDILPRYAEQLKLSHLLVEASFFSPKLMQCNITNYFQRAVILEMLGDPQLFKADTTFHAT